MLRECKICKKEFNISPAFVNRGEGLYCSRECKDMAQSNWLKSLTSEQHPRWKGGLIEMECANCNKTIKVKRCLAFGNRFCCKSCANSFNSKKRPKKRIERICLYCFKSFKIHPNKLKRTDRNEGKFCSQSCRAMYSIKNQKKKNTNIEIIFEKWLKTHRIKYKKQKPIRDIALVDFFIIPNICIFVDGDYWHNKPERKEIDTRQTNELVKYDYLVFRVVGSKLLRGEYPNEILQYC